jgi:hypothetical protein
MKLATRHPGIPVLIIGDRAVDVDHVLRAAGYLGETPPSVRDILERWPELGDPLHATSADGRRSDPGS